MVNKDFLLGYGAGKAAGGPSPTGTKTVTVTDNGTTTENVSSYAAVEIVVAVPSASGVSF